MNTDRDLTLTRLLHAWRDGDPEAADAVLPHVYAELRRMARKLYGHQSSTLQPTMLAHDAYLRLRRQGPIRWQDRRHFYGVAARSMRQVFVDHLRHRRRIKRGGDLQRTPLADDLAVERPTSVDVLALHEALKRLERIDPDKARIVELRFFAGLSIAETAEALTISPASVVRRWRRARAWLYHALTPERDDARGHAA